MNFFEKIAKLFGSLNIKENEFDIELTKKMRLMNLIVILVSPLIF